MVPHIKSELRFNLFDFLSLICEELDRPRTGEEDEKSEDIKDKENEKDGAERRKIRGETLNFRLIVSHRRALPFLS